MHLYIKEQWTHDLTSGKYTQGKGYLKQLDDDNDPCFCILGVLVDQYLESHPDAEWEQRDPTPMNPDTHTFKFEEFHGSLSCNVAKWAGLNADERANIRDLLVFPNDQGETFENLALTIKENF